MVFCYCLQSRIHASFATSWIAACQPPLSIGFPRQESWSSLPFSTPGDLPDPGIKPASPASLLYCRHILFIAEPLGTPQIYILMYVSLLTTPKALTVWITTNCGKFGKKWEYQTILPAF